MNLENQVTDLTLEVNTIKESYAAHIEEIHDHINLLNVKVSMIENLDEISDLAGKVEYLSSAVNILRNMMLQVVNDTSISRSEELKKQYWSNFG